MTCSVPEPLAVRFLRRVPSRAQFAVRERGVGYPTGTARHGLDPRL